MAWLNNDKLYLKYGTEKATTTKAGEYHQYGHLHEVEIKIDLTTLTETETIKADVTTIPAGARIVEVEVLTHTAAATGTAIDVGLIKSSDRTTEIDYNGLLEAFITATMNADGEKTFLYEATSTGGALIGTTLAYTGLISASRTDATAFTTGVIYVTVRYYMPV